MARSKAGWQISLRRPGRPFGVAFHADQDRVRHRAVRHRADGPHLPAARASVATRRPDRAREPAAERRPRARGVHRQLRQPLRPGERAARHEHRAADERRPDPRFRRARRDRSGCAPARSDRAAVLDPAIPPAQPLLRGRQRAAPPRLDPLRQRAAGHGPGAGDLRLRPLAPQVQLQDGAPDPDRARRLSRAGRGVPRLHPPGDHALPLHEHSGALHHRLPRRHRRPAGARADGLQRLVRGLPRRPLVHLRRPPQPPAHRPHRHGTRPRRR